LQYSLYIVATNQKNLRAIKIKYLTNDLTHIIQGCIKQEKLMQKNLYEHCYRNMMKVCCRYTNDVEIAGSLYNDAMVKVFKNINNYKEDGKFIGWVKTIVIHTCIDHVRIKSPIALKEYTTDYNEAAFVDNEIIEKLDNAAIKQIINTLPKNSALVFNLFVYEQYSHNEIATLLNIPSGTSRYYLSEARSLLKNMFTNNILTLNKI
jgi:RNA polymerase sigma-70 factor, ECF subfamily